MLRLGKRQGVVRVKRCEAKTRGYEQGLDLKNVRPRLRAMTAARGKAGVVRARTRMILHPDSSFP